MEAPTRTTSRAGYSERDPSEEGGMLHRVSDAASNTLQQTGHLIQERPASAALTCFGFGFGIGVVLGATMANAASQQRHVGHAERLGRQVLDALTGVMPDTLSQRLKG